MGLLHDKAGQEDYDAILTLARSVAEVWNTFGGTDHGFRVRVGEKEVQECCSLGHEILITSKKFPNPPGPFKRVAALVVLARLYPFFELDPPPPYPQACQIWLARVIGLLIPATLSTLEVNISKDKTNPKWEQLNNWRGFASPHYKIEFLVFLQWLDGLSWIRPIIDEQLWQSIRKDRLARMILATSLIIEANYYCTETGAPNANHLRGKCKGCVEGQDLTPLNYDERLYDKAKSLGFATD
jgi:hypothetical protein